jgi:IS6 family transposase
MSRSCWLSAASRSTTSPSTAGQRFTPLFADAARPCRHAAGDRWFVDETYVKVAGRWRYLYRAVDQYGQVTDVLLAEQRDTAAARRFFIQALRHGPGPVEVTTDKAPVHRDIVDVDAAVGQQLLDVPVGRAVAEVPADGDRDHLPWEPEPGKR